MLHHTNYTMLTKLILRYSNVSIGQKLVYGLSPFTFQWMHINRKSFKKKIMRSVLNPLRIRVVSFARCAHNIIALCNPDLLFARESACSTVFKKQTKCLHDMTKKKRFEISSNTSSTRISTEVSTIYKHLGKNA